MDENYLEDKDPEYLNVNIEIPLKIIVERDEAGRRKPIPNLIAPYLNELVYLLGAQQLTYNDNKDKGIESIGLCKDRPMIKTSKEIPETEEVFLNAYINHMREYCDSNEWKDFIHFLATRKEDISTGIWVGWLYDRQKTR